MNNNGQSEPKKQISRTKYSVEKNVEFGKKYLEVQYKPIDNFLIGKWIKIGVNIQENPGNKKMICEFCKRSFESRKAKHESLAEEESLSREVPVSPSQSYQVPGWTNPLDKYNWERNTCNNPNCCWGNKQHVITFQRMMKDSSTSKFRITQYKIFDYDNSDGSVVFVEKDVNTQYFNLKHDLKCNRSGYGENGFGVKFLKSSSPPFFWPGLHSGLQEGLYFCYIEIRRNGNVPEHLKNIPFDCWPYEVGPERRSYRYPHTMDITFYKATIGLPDPTSKQELDQNHKKASLTCIDVYPGGAGMAVSQWKYVDKDDSGTQPYDDGRYKLLGGPACWPPGYIPKPHWVDKEYFTSDEAYIPGHQPGWSGPVVSYFERYNSTPEWFSI